MKLYTLDFLKYTFSRDNRFGLKDFHFCLSTTRKVLNKLNSQLPSNYSLLDRISIPQNHGTTLCGILAPGECLIFHNTYSSLY